jgi:hypothetical protein
MIKLLNLLGRMFCMLLLIGSMVTSIQAYSQPGEAHAMSVAVEVERIRNEPSSAARTTYAQQLAGEIRQNRSATLEDTDIQLLANLLSDRDDSVRYWIAMALGYLGPRAHLAVPALEKALEEKQCDNSSKTSASAIKIALSRIGVKVAQANCLS